MKGVSNLYAKYVKKQIKDKKIHFRKQSKLTTLKKDPPMVFCNVYIWVRTELQSSFKLLNTAKICI